MAKEILDIYIEQGYSYNFDLDFNTSDNIDLENDYLCWFENSSIGKKQFTSDLGQFKLTLTDSDTNKVTTNLQSYVVYAQEIVTGEMNKLLSGRIIVDKKVKD